jgi:hypothetical protein
MTAVGARGKPSAVFQGPVGAFCASTGPAASTASSPVHGSWIVRPPTRYRIETYRMTFGLSRIEKPATRRSSHGAIVDPGPFWAVVFSRGGLRSAWGRFSPALRMLGPETRDIEFQQHRMVHEAINRRGCRHLVPKDPIPLRKD